jgi:ABC-type branched-subunit amino acid transport system substrate-binding protein
MYSKDHSDSKIIIIDSESDPNKAISAYNQEALTNNASVIITALSPVSAAILPVAKANGAFQVALATTVSNAKGSDNLLRFLPSSIDATKSVAEYAAKKYKDVCVFYPNDDFGIACNNIFKKFFLAKGTSQKLYSLSYNIKETDVRSLVQSALQNKPEAIFIAGYGNAYINIFKALRENNYTGDILAEYSVMNPDVVKNLGPLLDGVIFAGFEIDLTNPISEDAQKFIKVSREMKMDPSMVVAVMYNALSLIDDMRNNNKRITQEGFMKYGEWHKCGIKSKFVTPGETSFILELMMRKDGKNIALPRQ